MGLHFAQILTCAIAAAAPPEATSKTIASTADASLSFYAAVGSTITGRYGTLQLNASLSLEDRQYEADDLLFQTARDDRQTDLSLGLAYRLGKHVSIRPNYTYTDNDSNIVINDYQRHVVSVDIRYER